MDILTATRSGYVRPGSGAVVGQDSRNALLGTSGARLFETDSDVRNYANRVNAQVVSLEADILNHAKRLYGPQGFAASITSAQLAKFQSDKAFYQSWSEFRRAWEAFKADIDASSFIVLSANKYREVEKYDTDVRAWRERFKAQGIQPTAPPTTQPGTVPGVTNPTNPAAPPAPKDPNAFNWNNALLLGGAVVALLLLREVRPEREVILRSPPKPPPGPSLGERYRGAREGWREPRRLTSGRSSSPRRLTSGRRNDVIDAEFVED